MTPFLFSILFVQWYAASPLLPNLGKADSNRYVWTQAIPPGNSRSEEQWREGTWPHVFVQSVVLNDTLLIIGKSHTWKSADGIRWKMFRHDGKWGTRYGASYSTYNGKIWMMGGSEGWEQFESDVWSSTDGLHWTLVTAAAGWTGRMGHAALVYKEKIWVIGGAESSGKPDVLPTHSQGDVWTSKDGKNWECVGRNAPWQAPYSKAFFSTAVSGHVLNGRLWVLGGPEGNEIWHSTDGEHWTRSPEHTPWPSKRPARGSAIFNGKMWIFGGPGLNDVWYTDDGDSWNQLRNAPWSPRAPYYAVVFRNRLWMFGGKTGRYGEGKPTDDVWFIEDSAIPETRNSP